MNLVLRDLGRAEYGVTWQAMQDFTAARDADTADALWCVEHPPVFTLGRAGKPEHLLAPGDIPVVHTDRGGQVTYHGPGQLVVYTLLDVRRLGIGPRELVRRIESGLIACLAEAGIAAGRRDGAPGVYVGAAKIAALGLRIRGSYSYHGLALNVAMDREPFGRINPCGYAGLAVTDMREQGVAAAMDSVRDMLLPQLIAALYEDQPVQLQALTDLGGPLSWREPEA